MNFTLWRLSVSRRRSGSSGAISDTPYRRKEAAHLGHLEKTLLGRQGKNARDIVQKLRRQFGLRNFRPGQERVIRNVLGRRDTLAVMPTGSGN